MKQEERKKKGYPTSYGFVGYLYGRYCLFSTEDEYQELKREKEETDGEMFLNERRML
jgi:hypothetical protein